VMPTCLQQLLNPTDLSLPGAVPKGAVGGRVRPAFKKSGCQWPQNAVSNMHCAMFVLVPGLCLTFSGADIELNEFDFVLMSGTSAYLILFN